MREGLAAHCKSVLLGVTSAPQNEEALTSRAKESDTMARNLIFGLPMHLPATLGYKRSRREIHPDHLPEGPIYPNFSLPVFKINTQTIPAKAASLLDRWAKMNPHDLIYPQVAFQKILQWIWLMKNPLRRIEPGLSPDSSPVPHVTLGEWLKCAHFYESFHQTHSLTFYIHPFRFVDTVLRESAHSI
jgi:hypothetical protein